jgi:16S rRNA (adenine1518-N6/adenine1519-N6)-dimethyltransferase
VSDDAPNLPPLIEVIRRHGLEPKKNLGQNFLLDPRLIDRIARATGPLDGVHVVEVGPGPGGLTRALLAAGAAQVVAIERDARCVAALQDLAAAYPGGRSRNAGAGTAPDHRQPALQHRHAPADRLAAHHHGL